MMTLLRSFQVRYLALLAVYFSVGLGGLTAVTNTFFIRDYLHLTGPELISIGIWTSLPWSIKMLFGAFIDGVPLLGSHRKNYIYLGQILIVLSIFGSIDHVSTRLLISHLGEYIALTLTGVVMTIGVVISDIVVDTMAIEITQDQTELGLIQVWCRLAQSVGAVLGAALTGYLAKYLEPSTVYALVFVCPLLAVVGTVLTPLVHQVVASPLDKKMVLGGLLFGVISVVSGMISKDYGTLILLVLCSLILVYLFRQLTLDRTFVYAMVGLFLFRASPGIGPGLQWFYMGKLGFDEIFLGHLALISNIIATVSLVLLAKVISEGNFLRSLTWIAVLGVVLSVPDIVVFYDLLGSQQYARQITLIDSSLIAPIAGLSMIPLGIIVAKSAPAAQRAVYISLTASLMNLALVAGDAGTQILNQIYIVTRDDQTYLGILMIVSLVVGTGMYVGSLLILRKGLTNNTGGK